MIAELEVVRLRSDRPEDGLSSGAEGTVVMVYAGGKAYEVEFVDREGQTVTVCTVTAAEIEPLAAPRASSGTESSPRPRPGLGGRKRMGGAGRRSGS